MNLSGDCRPDVQPSCSNEAQVTLRFAAACVCGFQFDFGLLARLKLEVMQVFESANCSDGDEQSIMLVVSTSFVLCSHNLHLCTIIICWTARAQCVCILIQASAEARDMALGLYERDPVHPLNPDMVC